MPFHDPRREVEKLRDHLASHDKPIAFLVGAGASCSVRDASGVVLDPPLIPSVAAMGDLCAETVGALSEEHKTAYAQIVIELPSTDPPDIEEILSTTRLKVAAMTDDDELSGASRSQLVAIEQVIRQTIAKAALPEESQVPDRLPHHALARWIGRIDRACPVELFTSNYDTLLERALEDERVPIFDGFVGSRQPFFSAASLSHEDAAPGRQWTRLWKIHGSVNWAGQTMRDGTRRIVRGTENAGGELILPSFHKYDESRKQPYVAMLDRLGRVLTSREDTVLITIGYSFGDQHINEVLFDALDVRDRMHIIAMQFADPPPDHELVKRAERRHNLLVYGPTTAIVGGVSGQWHLVEPVDERTAGLLDVPFDSDAEPAVDKAPVTGRFRLGDFYWFGRFLDQIAGTDA